MQVGDLVTARHFIVAMVTDIGRLKTGIVKCMFFYEDGTTFVADQVARDLEVISE
tara:strand:- start:52 stop:216 length:165 start_codon:yes stop_codon:yes gene_type:complete